MSVQKPLSFLTLKCILLYCKANLRIILSQQSPFVHSFEKSLPLRIEKLKLETMYVKLDDTEFHLQTIHKLPDFPPFGFHYCDLDEYGVPTSIHDYVPGPGDILIPPQRFCTKFRKYPDLETFEFIMSQLIRKDMLRCDDPIQNKKAVFAVPELVDPNFCDLKLDDYVWFCGNVETLEGRQKEYQQKNTSGNPNFIETATSWKIMEGKRVNVAAYAPTSGPFIYIAHLHLTRIQRICLIEQLQAHILPLQHRHCKIKPSYKCYLQLTMVSPRGTKTEVVEYRKSIHVAMKYLNEKIFGGRNSIAVEHLEFGNEETILHLPKPLKIRLMNLKVGNNWENIIDNFLKVLDDSSFPLKSIECDFWSFYDSKRYQVVQNTRQLKIPSVLYFSIWNDILLRLTNFHVHMKKMFLPMEAFITFLRRLIELHKEKRKVCGFFTFGITSATFSEDVLRLLQTLPSIEIEEVPENISAFPHRFRLRLVDSTELAIYGTLPTSKELEDSVLWILNVKVVSR